MDENNETIDFIRNMIREETKKINASPVKDVSISEVTQIAKAGKDLKDAFASPIESAIVERFNERVMDRIFPMMDAPAPKQGFLDSGFMMAVGSKLPDILPTLFDVAVTRLGKEKTEQIIDGFQNRLTGAVGGNVINEEINGNQNVDEFILSLDTSDPADIHRYMSLRNISDINDAVKKLTEEKNYTMQKYKSRNVESNYRNIESNFGNSVNNNSEFEKILNDQIEMVKQLIMMVQEDKDKIGNLTNELEKLKNSNNNENKVIRNVNNIVKKDVTDDDDYNDDDIINGDIIDDDYNDDYNDDIINGDIINGDIINDDIIKDNTTTLNSKKIIKLKKLKVEKLKVENNKDIKEKVNKNIENDDVVLSEIDDDINTDFE